MNQSPEAPIELTIRDLPLSESVRDFQWLRRFWAVFHNVLIGIAPITCHWLASVFKVNIHSLQSHPTRDGVFS